MAEIAATAREAASAGGIVPGSEAERQLLTMLIGRMSARCAIERVYLFGSRAHGIARISSDVDLLVVVPEEQATAEYWSTLLDVTAHGPVVVDVALSTPDEFAWRSLVPGFVEFDALQQGLLLYG